MLAGSPAPNEYILNIHCSKGTYVRVLLEDIGRALGVPATMAALRLSLIHICKDSRPGHLVFNRSVSLKDSFKK